MTVIQLLSAVSGAILMVTTGAVAFRLLILARRTRQLPELTVGLGLSAVLLVGAPMMALGGVGRLPAGEVNIPATALGLGAISAGFLALYVFNWKVFRRESSWAPYLVGAAAILLLASTFGCCMALATSPIDASSVEVTQGWVALLWIAALGCYAWAGFESLHHYGMARRRLDIGLGDPIVVNRFLLWGVANLGQLLIHGFSFVLHFQGITASNHPVAGTLVALGGTLCGVAMYLAFVPPAAYLRLLVSDREPVAAG